MKTIYLQNKKKKQKQKQKVVFPHNRITYIVVMHTQNTFISYDGFVVYTPFAKEGEF